MSGRPSYRELQTRVRQLQQEVSRLRQVRQALHDSEEIFRMFANVSNDMICLCDRGGNIVYANPATRRLLGYSEKELVRMPVETLVHPDDRKRTRADFDQLMDKGETAPTREIRLCRHDGTYIDVLVDSVVMNSWGREKYVGSIVRNTTILKQSARALLKTNQKLQQEIEERKLVEEQLLESRRDLHRKAAYLEETNIALNVLLKKREKDKAVLEEQVSANIRDLVLPSLEKVRCGKLEAGQKALMDIALLNLQEVTSRFSLKMSSRYFSFSPVEAEVVNFILHGKSTKEIADALNIGVQTAKNHRLKIREKVGIKNKKVNLRTYLSSLV